MKRGDPSSQRKEQQLGLGVIIHIYNPSYSGGGSRRTMVWGQLQTKILGQLQAKTQDLP
jgi:hypothetical protein